MTNRFAISGRLGGGVHIYRFENPQVDLTRSDTMPWESINPGDSYLAATVFDYNHPDEQEVLLANSTNTWASQFFSIDGFGAFAGNCHRYHAGSPGDLLHLRLFSSTRLLPPRREDHDGGRFAP